MKFVSWNVNGLRACMGKGFMDFFHSADADVFALQETKLQIGQLQIDLPGYRQYWNYAQKKGYSGTAVFTREKPIRVIYGIGLAEHDGEGRLITLEFSDFYFVTAYAPNAQRELKRLSYRLLWEDAFRSFVMRLDETKPVIICGDLNVAHQEIDLKNPKANRRNAGFTDEERERFSLLAHSGFTDTFRYLYPDRQGAYTWWSYMFNARATNAGWRIDYFLVSSRWADRIQDSLILDEVMGSDHCPVALALGP